MSMEGRRIATYDDTGKIPVERLPELPVQVVQGAAGPSAYQLAVEAGFVGTQAEWLASLQGPPGTPGTDAVPHPHPYAPDSHAIDGVYHTGVAVLPTQGQKNALAGTSGTPGTTNPYVTGQDARLSDPRAPTAHSHAEADTTGLVADLAAKAAASHGHTEANVTGLVADLAAKAAVGHGHTEAEVSNLVADLAAKAAAAHSHLDADLPAGLARDTEVTAAVATHEGAANPHPTYETSAEAAAKVTAHEALADPHPGYLTPAEGGLAYQPLDSDLSAIAALATTPFGRGLLALADAAALAGAHTHPAGASAVSVAKKTADQAFTAVALADVADLAVPLAINADVGFEFLIAWQSAATTTGVRFALNGPAGLVELTALVEVQLTVGTWQTADHVAYESGAATASIDAANTRRVARIKGIVRNGGTAGNLVLRCATEVAASGITVKRGSHVTYF